MTIFKYFYPINLRKLNVYLVRWQDAHDPRHVAGHVNVRPEINLK